MGAIELNPRDLPIMGWRQVDLDTLKQQGVYSCDGSSTNSPNSANQTLLVLTPASDRICQIAIQQGKGGVMYTRHKVGSTWNSWQRVDGGGS